MRHETVWPCRADDDMVSGDIHGKGISQPAHLHDINETGIYLITRVRLAVNERIEIEVPSRRRKDVIRMTVKVIRPGRHRCWGLFSYGCRLLESHGR